jgi:hypothetical protein
MFVGTSALKVACAFTDLVRNVRGRPATRDSLEADVGRRQLVVEDFRVQPLERGGWRSFTIVGPDGTVHEEADRFLLAYDGSGTQRTYAHYLVDHLRWCAREGLDLATVEPATSWPGYACSPCPVSWPAPNPRPCATGCCTPPGASYAANDADA